MKNTISLLLCTIVLLACGTSTKLNTSIAAPEVQPKRYNKLAVLAFLPARTNRAIVEEAVEKAFLDKGVQGRVTYDMFPLAGDKEMIEKMDLDPTEVKEIVREKVTKNNIDGLLTISLLDSKSEDRYVEGARLTVGVPLYAIDPVYSYTYSDYYNYAYTTVSKPGYYVKSTTYFFECNLFDIATEKLIWTGQTTTKDPNSVEKEAATFSQLIVNDLLRKGVLKK